MKIGSELSMDLQKLVNAKSIGPLRNGGFDDCAISGEQYEGQDGKKFWDITIVSADNYRCPSKRMNVRCLVVGEVFECANVEMPAPSFDIRKGEAIDIDLNVKQGALDILRKWETDVEIS
jgi:hypothetical protein